MLLPFKFLRDNLVMVMPDDEGIVESGVGVVELAEVALGDNAILNSIAILVDLRDETVLIAHLAFMTFLFVSELGGQLVGNLAFLVH
ncbi:MAG: hypothetical protein ACMG6E_05395, partial [Candidatus Roizmanbacteria bacterium]